MHELEKPQKMQLLGFALVFLGAFLPVFKVPVTGGVSLWDRFPEGLVVIALAIGGGIASLNFHDRAVAVCARVCLGLTGLSMGWFLHRLSALQAEVSRDMAGNPFGGFATAMVNSAGLNWGLVVLVGGALIALDAERLARMFMGESASSMPPSKRVAPKVHGSRPATGLRDTRAPPPRD